MKVITRNPFKRIILRFIRNRRRMICRHEFNLDDMRSTGIKERPMPEDQSDYEAYCEWFITRYDQPAHTHRIMWKCSLCGKVFYAHCGLDILAQRKV